MRLKLTTYWLCAIGLLCSLGACGDDGFGDCGADGPGPVKDGTYLLLRLNLAREGGTAGSRSPKAGEDGDGREPGVFHENDIDDLCVFAYNSEEGVNAPATTPIEGAVYVKDIGFTHPGTGSPVYSMAAPVLLESLWLEKHTHFIIAVNMGDFTGEVSNLGELRDYRVARPWKEASAFKDYTAFTMASESDSRMLLEKEGVELGSQEHPVEVTVDVERTAARIDFVLAGDVEDTEGTRRLKYEVPGADGTGSLAKVYLTHARVVNAMQQPTYLLKRTASGPEASGRDYLGTETVDKDGMADNYVMEPTTGEKRRQDPEEAVLESWFGETRFANYLSEGAGYFTDEYKIHVERGDGTTGFDTGLSEYDIFGTAYPYYVMGYVNENTMFPECSTFFNATGIVVRALYVPCEGHVYGAYDPETGELSAATGFDFKKGQTFWRYAPSRVEMKEHEALYFSNEEAARAYGTAHPEDAASVTEYTDGVCYYNIWLRHADNGDNALVGTMEYGIVRNNIYQILIKSFSGPGTNGPNPHGPDNASSVIYVRPWNVRVQPEIVI